MTGSLRSHLQIGIGLLVLGAGLAICILLSARLGSRPAASEAGPVEIANDFSSFTDELTTQPGDLRPNEPAKLTFAVKDGLGKLVGDFEIVNTKPMHLVVVSEDLSFFNHIHPEANPDGTYSVETMFPWGGRFKAFLDYTPSGGGAQIGRNDISVDGPPHKPVQLVADKPYQKQFGDLRIRMSCDKPYRTDEALRMSFEVWDSKTGKPVTDLQPYLGAWAHFVIISEDGEEFLHAHPLEMIPDQSGAVSSGGPAALGGPKVTTRAVFPKAGLYKLWAQFQRKNSVTTADFAIKVESSYSQQQTLTAQISEAGVQEAQVTVNANGYDPPRVKLRKGTPARIVFTRTDDNNCAGEVVFRELGIRQTLPVGIPVAVEFMPKKDGQYTFTCGMNMLRGALIVAQ